MESLLHADLHNDREELIAQAVHANIRAATNQLRHGSAILGRLIAEGRLQVVGAHYSLEAGLVEFYLDR